MQIANKNKQEIAKNNAKEIELTEGTTNTQMEKDTQSRKWLLTFQGSHIQFGFNHTKIKEELSQLKSVVYYCLADEIGLTSQNNQIEQPKLHSHLFIFSDSPIRASTLERHFPKVHRDACKGGVNQNREYVAKIGKWENHEKSLTKIENSFEEHGDIPLEKKQGARTDLEVLYEKIKDGLSNIELLNENPNYMKHLTNVERVRQEITADIYKNRFRQLQVTFIYGPTNVGKTRYVMEKYGYGNVYRITDYKHPFDGYLGHKHNVIVFDEFTGQIPIYDINNYLDSYPLALPARYFQRQACYEVVYIISNIDLTKLYKVEQAENEEVYNAFLRRIHRVMVFRADGEREEYSTKEYMQSKKIKYDTKENIPLQYYMQNQDKYSLQKKHINNKLVR